MNDVIAVLVLRVTILLLVACGIVFVLRRASAAARHGVWALTLVALLLLPVAAAVLPTWELAVLPALPSAAVPEAPVAAEAVSFDASIDAPIAAPDDGGADAVFAPVATPVVAWSWRDAVIAVWAVGAVAGLLRVVFGLWLVGRLARDARRLDDPQWTRLVDEARARLRLTSAVRVLETDRVAVPVVYGLWRPVVLIPTKAAVWPEARRRAFLVHELAHVLRRDCLVQTMASVARALYWPHPLAWWAQRRLRAEAERASDDRVVAAGMPGPEYAQLLLEAARALGRAPQPLAVVAIVERSSLEDRLVALLDPSVRRGALGRGWALLAPPIAAVLVATLAAVQLVSPPALAEALVVGTAVASPPVASAAPASSAMPVPSRAPARSAATKPAPAKVESGPAVEGAITDAGGKPVDGALVLVRNETAPLSTPAEFTRSDKTGRFRLPVPEAATLYRVRVEAAEWAPQVLRLQKTGAPIHITLEPAETLEGLVLDKETKKPVADAEVVSQNALERITFRVEDKSVAGTIATVRTGVDANGRFRLGSLAKGRQNLRVTATGYQPADLRVIAGGGNVEALLTPLAPGQVATTGATEPPRSGRLEPEQVAALEEQVAAKTDLEAREKLLRHYLGDRTPEGRVDRIRHALWVIEHAPDSNSTLAEMTQHGFHKRAAPQEHAQALALWHKHLELRGRDPRVLGNAARFLSATGAEDEAGPLLERGAALEPENFWWRGRLGLLYMQKARRGGKQAADAGEAKKALGHFEAALALRDNRAFLLRNAAEAALLAGEDAKAKDYASRLLQVGDPVP